MQHPSPISKFWKDKEGNIAVFQVFNLALIIWLVASVGSKLFEHGTVHNLMTTIAFGALFTWAYLEITKGDSYFRRVLGMLIMMLIIVNRL